MKYKLKTNKVFEVNKRYKEAIIQRLNINGMPPMTTKITVTIRLFSICIGEVGGVRFLLFWSEKVLNVLDCCVEDEGKANVAQAFREVETVRKLRVIEFGDSPVDGFRA